MPEHPQAVNRTAYFAAMKEHNDPTRPRIYAIDEPESTVYVLIRHELPPLMADWPHPLRQLCPEAVDGGTLGSEFGTQWTGHRDLTDDLMAVVDGWVREPGFAPTPCKSNRDLIS